MRGRNRKGPNPLARVFESNGPDVKIRGTASHIMEKYLSLARDAQSSGDPVAAENYLQHAEHYYRIIAAAQPQPMPHHPHQPFYPASEAGDDDWEGVEDDRFASYPERHAPDRQPSTNGFVPNGGMRHGGHEQPYPRQPSAPMPGPSEAQQPEPAADDAFAQGPESGSDEAGLPSRSPEDGGFRRPRRRGRYQRGDRRPHQQGGETPAAEPAPVD
jgi:hypothetical protein